MKPPTITTADWLAELSKIASHKGEGQTVNEMSKQYGIGYKRMIDILREAKKRGWLRLDYRTEEGFDGITRNIKIYSVRKPK